MNRRSLALLFIASVSFAGCSGGGTSTPAKPSQGGSGGKSDVISMLKQADKLDGKEDHVVSKCYVCGLGMSGEEKYAAKYKDYTVHLCSEGCKEHFEKSPETVIADTPVPKH